jgi:hypothetical protein
MKENQSMTISENITTLIKFIYFCLKKSTFYSISVHVIHLGFNKLTCNNSG